MKHAKIYISDEGYGHIVRQHAILEELRRLEPSLQATVQTQKHLPIAKRLMPYAQFIDKHNNIVWHKQENGSPDVEKIREYYTHYLAISEEFIRSEEKAPYDFMLSDFVYEAFELGLERNIPVFGVAHFTWDWFFCKLYPPVITSRLIYKFIELTNSARAIYFPPFTPDEITHLYTKNVVHVPLIMNQHIEHKQLDFPNQLKVLIIDSGAGVLKSSISRSLAKVSELTDVVFYVSESIEISAKNIVQIPKQELLVNYVKHADLVIGRAGFNTISECISCRTPMLLLGEAMNPEMNENIIALKKAGLGSFISMSDFEQNFYPFLKKFIKHEYQGLKENMMQHNIPTNGAEVIAKDILNKL